MVLVPTDLSQVKSFRYPAILMRRVEAMMYLTEYQREKLFRRIGLRVLEEFTPQPYSPTGLIKDHPRGTLELVAKRIGLVPGADFSYPHVQTNFWVLLGGLSRPLAINPMGLRGWGSYTVVNSSS